MIIPFNDAGALVISDRRFLQRLFLQWRDEDTVFHMVDNLTLRKPEVEAPNAGLTAPGRKSYKVSRADVRNLLDAMCEQYPRIAMFSDDVLRFRMIPADSQGQVKLHKELMRAGRVTLRDFTAVHTNFLKKRKASGPPAEGRPGARPRPQVQLDGPVAMSDRAQRVTPPSGHR